MAKLRNNVTLLILGLIMLVNALAYGTIIPLLYPYASRFGIGPLGLSMLFVSFSVAQFIATPVIGRLADRYGRRPLLILSIFGTGLSLAMFAGANSLLVLFIARILDGVTGGNISVAQAVIADTTKGPERAKAFGILGASFGFGFLFGPFLGGYLSKYGLSTPFYFSAVLAGIAGLAALFWLPETLPPGQRQPSKLPLFQFKKLATALFDHQTGALLAMGFLAAVALNAWIIGFQTSVSDVLHLSPEVIGYLFAVSGFTGIMMQFFGIRWIMAKFHSKQTILVGSLGLTAVVMASLFFADNAWLYALILVAQSVVFAPTNPVSTALLSERTKAEDQGGILGVNQSYLSLGQIVGPLLAGVIATYSTRSVFVFSGVILVLAALVMQWFYKSQSHKLDL
jgi:multidrug resistance protein